MSVGCIDISELEYRLDARKFNPLFYHLIRFMFEPTIRRIINMGGSSSGKTYGIAQAILVVTEIDGENTLVFRKVGASIAKTVWEDFKVAARQLGMYDRLKFKESIRQIVFENGAKIDFSGIDDPEKIKGISNYKRVFKDELSEFDKNDDDQIRKRLRGKEGQQIIDAFNPISESHWIKTDLIDKEEWSDIGMDVSIFGVRVPSKLSEIKSLKVNSAKTMLNPSTGEMEEVKPNIVLTTTTYLNNYWVVGSPNGKWGFYDRQCIADFEFDRINNPYFYKIYALAEWGVVQTGSEFFASFNRGKHCGSDVHYNPALPVHISVDNNHLPYITVTYWQADIRNMEKRIYQIGETCAAPPNNSIDGATKLVAEKLKELNPISVILHGDASTKAASTFDKEKRSWMDLFIDSLSKLGIEVIDKVSNRNPSVMLSGEFINRILEFYFPNITLRFSEECKHSISDYMGVQKDANGGMLKTKVKNKVTGQTYEDKGHLSDTMRYVVIDLLREEFIKYCNLRLRNTLAADDVLQYYNHTAIHYYSDDLLYLMPDICGRTVAAYGRRVKDSSYWHICSVVFSDNVLTNDELLDVCKNMKSQKIVMECARAYYPFARQLRESGLFKDVAVKKEGDDLVRRINATTSAMKDYVRFNSLSAEINIQYAQFISSLLDYDQTKENIHASACMSGFIQFITRNQMY